MTESIHLKRTVLTDRSTSGELYLGDGTFLCHTLEDVCRKEKLRQMTAIPAGHYEVIVNWSNRFQRLMPRLLDVPFFNGILIHNGNYPEHTDGCILVGRKLAQDSIFESLLAFEDLFPRLRKLTEKGKLYIDIEGGYPADAWVSEESSAARD